MKTIILCSSYIKKNFMPIIITAILLTVSIFILTTFYGQYKFISYTRNVINNPNLYGSLYFMINTTGDIEVDQLLSSKIKKECSLLKNVEKIIDYIHYPTEIENVFYNIMVYSHDMAESFILDVTSGRWLDSNSKQAEAVVGGLNINQFEIGDVITLDNGVNAKIVGFIEGNVYYPSFQTSKNTNQTSSILFDVNDTMIFISGVDTEDFNNNLNSQLSMNFFIKPKNGISYNDYEDLKFYLKSNGMVATHDEIMMYSNNAIKEWIAGQFPIPIFLIIISTLNIICISTVIVKKNLSEYSKYYIIGCSKRRVISYIALPISLVFSLPCLLNLYSVIYNPNFFRAGNRIGQVDYIINAEAALPILAYYIFICIVIYTIPTLYYSNHSPLTFYRSNNQ